MELLFWGGITITLSPNFLLLKKEIDHMSFEGPPL